MKISILSMHRIVNYGSFLQAYALKNMVQHKENKVSFIDIKDGIYHMKKNEQTKMNKEKKCVLKRIRTKVFDIMIEKKIKKAQLEYLELGDYIYDPSNDCSMVIIGSDEIFNSSPYSSWGISYQLFGEINAPYIISYAASCGYFKEKDVPIEYKKGIKKSLKNLKAISVRDKNTFDFVKNISGCTSEYNLDPVLMYDFNRETERNENLFNIKGKYLIVYSYRDRIHSKEEVDSIKNYAKKNDLDIYCIGGVLSWCKNILVLNPFQVLNVFKNANCIITDTFHGSIFSIKYNKKFAVIIRDSNSNKLIDLLDRLNCSSRIVDKIENLESVLNSEFDYSYTNKIVLDEQNKTKNYLNYHIKKAEQNEN